MPPERISRSRKGLMFNFLSNSPKINTLKTIDELIQSRKDRFTPPIQHARRGTVKIAVIDDQHFEAGVNLRNYGYNITEIGDIKSVKEVAEFPVVLCDLMDVGRHFDDVNQGAAVIGEIRKNYPGILVAAYSGSSSTADPVKKARMLVDKFIQKDAEIEKWVENLDELISKATDPKLIWIRARKALIDQEIDSRNLLLLEDAYVRSIENKDSSFARMKQISGKEVVGNAASSIVSNLISSAIFFLIVG